MVIRFWQSPDKKKQAWYINEIDYEPSVKFFITLNAKGRAVIMGGKLEQNRQVKEMLIEAGFNYFQVFAGPADLTLALDDLGLLDTSAPKKPKTSDFGQRRKGDYWKSGGVDPYLPEQRRRSGRDLYEESHTLDVASAPFRPATKKSAQLRVDSREPDTVQSVFRRSLFDHPMVIEALPVGDIWVEFGKRLVIFERKTVSDFYNSITSNHMHSQAERMFTFQRQKEAEGYAVQIHWLIEHEKEGEVGLYHTLEQIKQIDGVVAYLSGILGQHINHTHLQHQSHGVPSAQKGSVSSGAGTVLSSA